MIKEFMQLDELTEDLKNLRTLQENPGVMKRDVKKSIDNMINILQEEIRFRNSLGDFSGQW